MARCDISSARTAGVDCAQFYRMQTQVAGQTHRFRLALRAVGAVAHRGGALTEHDQTTAARLDKYMGLGVASQCNRVASVHDVLLDAELQLISHSEIVKFDKRYASGGETFPGSMILGNELNATTILHEAVHFGTAPWRRRSDVPYIRDGGIFGSIQTYGTLRAALQRARYGWQAASASAASYAWLVTGP